VSPTDDDSERISRLRALIEAGEQPDGARPAATRPAEPAGAGTNRSPLVLAIGTGVAIAVVVVVLLALGGDSGVKQPDDTTSRRVSVFPTRIAGGVEKGERVTICDDKAGGALATDVVVFGLTEEKVPLYGRTVLIDAYIPNESVGRFQGKNLGDFAVVQGQCGEGTSTTTTATTSPPVTEAPTVPPTDPTAPTQPPDSPQGGSQ
jgi:hypothetical protein